MVLNTKKSNIAEDNNYEIYSANDQNKFIYRNSIKYLDKLTNLKHLNIPAIKSLYRTKCRLMELRQNIHLEHEKKSHKRCYKCFLDFFTEESGTTKSEIKPVKLSRFAQQVLEKVKTDFTLTSYQRLYYKKIKKVYPNGVQYYNKMILTCGSCGHKTQILMNKPKSKSTNLIKPKPKPKKKKDKFCGLNKKAVLKSLQKNNKKPFTQLTINKVQTVNNDDLLVQNNESDASLNLRNFQTAEFIPLKANNKIKIKKPNQKSRELPIKKSKAKEKQNKKQLKSLTNILKNASEKNLINKNTNRLKAFLNSL